MLHTIFRNPTKDRLEEGERKGEGERADERCVRVLEKEKGCERAPFPGITAKDRLEVRERD